ncbi:rhodanese-like domain-containing protein [Oxyplasma meridianum]|uniref:Rhodanese-like domain-containing protein n=1 Tax=Oxyplasma meridianum TaxID=3073602 RepID=A0AAX4NEI5_9ARCH
MSFLDYFITPDGLEELDPETVEKKAQEKGTVIIDVRTSSEYGEGHIANSKHIPLGSIKDHISQLPKDQKYILICATGHRSRAAGAMFLKSGFVNVAHLKGGMGSWKRSGKNIEK